MTQEEYRQLKAEHDYAEEMQWLNEEDQDGNERGICPEINKETGENSD